MFWRGTETRADSAALASPAGLTTDPAPDGGQGQGKSESFAFLASLPLKSRFPVSPLSDPVRGTGEYYTFPSNSWRIDRKTANSMLQPE